MKTLVILGFVLQFVSTANAQQVLSGGDILKGQIQDYLSTYAAHLDRIPLELYQQVVSCEGHSVAPETARQVLESITVVMDEEVSTEQSPKDEMSIRVGHTKSYVLTINRGLFSERSDDRFRTRTRTDALSMLLLQAICQGEANFKIGAQYEYRAAAGLVDFFLLK